MLIAIRLQRCGIVRNKAGRYMKKIMSNSHWACWALMCGAAKMRGMQRVYNICEVKTIFLSRLLMFSEGFKNILSGFVNACEG